MKVTNRHRLPDAMVRAVTNDPYDSGKSDFTVTGLLRPPQQAGLMAEYRDELEEDASDRIWALVGQAIHAVIERSSQSDPHTAKNILSEQRLYTEVNGLTVGAKFDTLDLRTNTLQDFKVTSAWTRVYGSRMKEWEQQLNLYAHIARINGFDVERAEIIAIYRDWSESQKLRSGSGYPPTPAEAIPISLWPDVLAKDFLQERVRLHSLALISDWPQCTPEERWVSRSTYAVMKHGQQSARRVLDSEGEARDWMLQQEKRSQLYIQHRPGEARRCAKYCPVCRFCKQYRDECMPF